MQLAIQKDKINVCIHILNLKIENLKKTNS